MTMKEINELRAVADQAVEAARNFCGRVTARCGICVKCKDVEYAENLVLTALQEWWAQDCKDTS